MFPLRSEMYVQVLSEPPKNFEQTILPLIKKCYLKKQPQESYLVLLRLCLVPMYDRYAATLLYTYLFTVKKNIYIYIKGTLTIYPKLSKENGKSIQKPNSFWPLTFFG